MHPKTLRNTYVDRIGEELFDGIPKPVLLAILLNYTEGVLGVNLEPEYAQAMLLNIWDKLYKEGVVSQKVPPKMRHILTSRPEEEPQPLSVTLPEAREDECTLNIVEKEHQEHRKCSEACA